MTRVLFVENHSATRHICSDILRDHGYEVVEARNGRCALECAQHYELDAVITDWLLSDMDGLYFLDRLRRRYPSLPIIVFSTQPHLCPNARHIAKLEAIVEKTESLTNLLSALDAVCQASKPAHCSDSTDWRLNRSHAQTTQHLQPKESPQC
jgi:two-component system, NarL family, invasion response regulator UvrY